jgi:hypothetical protein
MTMTLVTTGTTSTMGKAGGMRMADQAGVAGISLVVIAGVVAVRMRITPGGVAHIAYAVIRSC